jgi:hypothetical protein
MAAECHIQHNSAFVRMEGVWQQKAASVPTFGFDAEWLSNGV